MFGEMVANALVEAAVLGFRMMTGFIGFLIRFLSGLGQGDDYNGPPGAPAV